MLLLFRRVVPLGFVCLLASSLASAQQRSRVQLQASQPVFTVLTAINVCGYDDGLGSSDPVRAQVRSQVSQALERSSAARATVDELCQFYRDHTLKDPGLNLSQYVSLALNLAGPPDFKPRLKEADLPPDATYVLGLVPLLSRFYKDVDLQGILAKAAPHYGELVDKINEPVSNMILQTDVYLKDPISGYTGRQLTIFLEPMAAPGQVNARNYGDDYFLVTAPVDGKLPMEQVRHTYLHFVLDSLAPGHPMAMKRLAPLLKPLQSAPLEDVYKRDITLVVTESLIRAVETRLLPGGRAADPRREQDIDRDMADGFILTRFFYNQLVKFEPEPTSLKDAFPDFLYDLDVGHQAKLASEIHWASEARQEIVKGVTRAPKDPLDLAEQKIGDGDLSAAQKLASEEASKNDASTPRAYFVLGEIATLNKDEDGAIKYFEQTLRTAKEPNLIAWAHIYLGRIYDVDQQRDLAVKHYQAALRSGDDTPQTKAAAEKGLNASYERHVPAQPEQQDKDK